MAQRVLHYYEFKGREPEAGTLKNLFKKNLSKCHVPFFLPDSKEEQLFQGFCREHNFEVVRKTVVEYDGREGSPDTFLFLVTKDDGGKCVLGQKPEFVDFSEACTGDGSYGLCDTGARQMSGVRIQPGTEDIIAKLGIVCSRNPYSPRIFLISSLVAEAIRSHDATGCKVVETNLPGFFQLQITAETVGPACVGQAQTYKQCPICGTVKAFLGSSERYFKKSDLIPSDFQICRVYHADNIGAFNIPNGFPIVSKRIFDVFLGLRLKGLSAYATDPPIQNAVVQVRS